MRNSFKLKLLAAAILMTSSVTHAAPNVMGNWGVHDDPVEHASVLLGVGAGSFDHVFTFNLANWNGLVSIAVTNDFGKFNINGSSLQLWKETSADGNYTNDTSLGSFAFDSSSVGMDFGNLGPGNYYYEVTGTVLGLKGGSYTVDSYISPVPEPETYAMLLAGLGMIGFSVRRRRPI
ncbi:FxDxF family PEP-CTERM protein [Nitrosomonas ureae]|uniref:PEP-CTERM protein-sorting domain-containing protein n=1 Tax=Nitrosomonas ureae TaxID=44577 RepID=A0A286AFW3_9PROT|nr:FxDxF family PEP-CTERM protein [Nitrosomonas ureae]PTQ80123.1 putative secreted protein with PEP-CTERM sorting signal [Nitrosomonas ureae]PXX14693.1 putative secreted protein with PEP-CTERM sorting signal [Nitrosomonas ureae]SOD20799.1 PEP-CTERM protein-sorting domain-containing protein [Nitrosomonas ureae]